MTGIRTAVAADETSARDRTAPRLALILLAGIFCIRLITLPLYPLLDKTEARYAYIAELMLQTGNWVTPFIEPGVPFWAKPILSFWLTVTSFELFGLNVFAARLPALLIFVAVAWLVFALGRDERGCETGTVSACIFSSTVLAFYFGGTVMTDPALLLGVTLVMFGFWKAVGQTQKASRLYGYLFFVGLAIGLLAKGPIGAVLPGLSIAAFVAYQRKWSDLWHRLPWFAGSALVLLLVLPWYALAEMRTPGFLNYFIIGEHFERYITPHWEGSLYEPGRPHAKGTIVLYVLIATLPWSVILPISILRSRSRGAWLNRQTLSMPWPSFLICWLLGSVVLFAPASNILLSYAATSVPAFALLAAQAFQMSRMGGRGAGFVIATMLVPVLFLAGVIAGLIEPQSNLLRSQQGIIATYENLTKGKKSELYYVVNKPYSADFYSRGRARRIEHINDIAGLMNDPANYFVVEDHMYQELPEAVRSKLAVFADRNGYLLLRLDAETF